MKIAVWTKECLDRKEQPGDISRWSSRPCKCRWEGYETSTCSSLWRQPRYTRRSGLAGTMMKMLVHPTITEKPQLARCLHALKIKYRQATSCSASARIRIHCLHATLTMRLKIRLRKRPQHGQWRKTMQLEGETSNEITTVRETFPLRIKMLNRRTPQTISQSSASWSAKTGHLYSIITISLK